MPRDLRQSAWVIDVVDYLTYHYFGFLGLTILSAAVITLCFYIYDKTFSPPDWLKPLYPLSVWVGYHIFAYSFRGQVLSFLFLGLVVCQLISYAQKPSKNIYWLAPLFVIWANIHGQFIVGLGVIFAWTAWQTLKRFDPNLIFALILCIGATLFNPYGYHIYQESLSFFHQPYTQLITEWQAPEVGGIIWWKLVIWTILVSTAVILYLRKKNELVTPFVILSIVFIVLSFSSRRYISSLIAVSLPIILIYFKQLRLMPKNLITALTISAWSIIIIVALPINFYTENFYQMSWEVYCDKYFDCSTEGAEYLKSHNLTSEVLAPYTWGGWLIWNYPEIKPFTDGRMNLWQENGFFPFKETVDFENGNRHIDDSPFKTVFIGKTTPLYLFISQLPNWRQVYSDERSGVFIRQDSENNKAN